jgi:hypothetical protein
MHHALMDRYLAADMLRYAMDGKIPSVSRERQLRAAERVARLLPPGADVQRDAGTGDAWVPLVVGNRGLWIAHTLVPVPPGDLDDRALATDLLIGATSEFEALRRPQSVISEFSLA